MTTHAFSLQGKVAVITGANTGIGQALAIALASAGARIIALTRSPAEETARAVASTGQAFHAINCGIEKLADIQSAMQQAAVLHGHVDILINNAGTIRRSAALDFSEADWDEVMGVNLKSAFFLSQAFAKQCQARPTGAGMAKIINIASMLSFQGGMRVASYTASKSGLLGLTRLLANEWAALGINVNALAPGYIETNNTAPLRSDVKRNQDILARIPAGRWGKPDDLAGAAVFLASAASDYVHGSVLPVDGGWLCR
jgi:2-dehydro-3-deoxy-D-gluconate 5-dehydrogenase